MNYLWKFLVIFFVIGTHQASAEEMTATQILRKLYLEPVRRVQEKMLQLESEAELNGREYRRMFLLQRALHNKALYVFQRSKLQSQDFLEELHLQRHLNDATQPIFSPYQAWTEQEIAAIDRLLKGLSKVRFEIAISDFIKQYQEFSKDVMKHHERSSKVFTEARLTEAVAIPIFLSPEVVESACSSMKLCMWSSHIAEKSRHIYLLYLKEDAARLKTVSKGRSAEEFLRYHLLEMLEDGLPSEYVRESARLAIWLADGNTGELIDLAWEKVVKNLPIRE